ncbi:MAG: M56 family metallopeptidase, partial [Oscillospiraceae bacterium]|nr:M56 family metallopeptidase [Oscillospiraceae bacterium]
MGLLQMSFSGAVLILAIVIIRAIAIDRLPKKTFLALWIIALVRLLLPFSVPSPFSIYSLVSRKVSDVEISDTAAYEYIQPVFEAVSEGSQNLSAVNVPQALPASPSAAIWNLIWLIGMSVLAVSFLISYWRCRREFKTALPIHNDMITEWLSDHPLKRKIEIKQFNGIITPMTYGLFHPVILLPENTDWENKQQLRYILFHEYVHICRYDTALKALAAITLCIHWFDPMVWVLFILFNRDLELACDECVIRRFGDRPAYARMLISMEERKNRFAPFCNNFSKNAIEERIKSIMKMKKASV